MFGEQKRQCERLERKIKDMEEKIKKAAAVQRIRNTAEKYKANKCFLWLNDDAFIGVARSGFGSDLILRIMKINDEGYPIFKENWLTMKEVDWLIARLQKAKKLVIELNAKKRKR